MIHTEFIASLCESLAELQKGRFLHREDLPELWLLGSSAEFLNYGCHAQYGISYGHFIRSENGLKIVANLRDAYEKRYARIPKISIAVHCIGSDDPAVLKMMVRGYGVSLLQQLNGQERILPSLETIKNSYFSDTDKERIRNAMSGNGVIVGNGSSVAAELKALAEAYAAEDLMIVSHGYDLESRLDTFATIMKHWELAAS